MSSNDKNYTREELLELNDQKVKIEKEIQDWKSILDTEKNVGMDEALVDSEGKILNTND